MKEWRVQRHQAFLHRALDDWKHEIVGAHHEKLKTLTDIARNLYDRVLRLPPALLLPLKPHRCKIRRLSALSTPLYERRGLLLELQEPLVQVPSDNEDLNVAKAQVLSATNTTNATTTTPEQPASPQLDDDAQLDVFRQRAERTGDQDVIDATRTLIDRIRYLQRQTYTPSWTDQYNPFYTEDDLQRHYFAKEMNDELERRRLWQILQSFTSRRSGRQTRRILGSSFMAMVDPTYLIQTKLDLLFNNCTLCFLLRKKNKPLVIRKLELLCRLMSAG